MTNYSRDKVLSIRSLRIAGDVNCNFFAFVRPKEDVPPGEGTRLMVLWAPPLFSPPVRDDVLIIFNTNFDQAPRVRVAACGTIYEGDPPIPDGCKFPATETPVSCDETEQ